MKRLIGWVLFTVALLAFGVGIGLGISWGILPVKMVNTTPNTLKREDKDRYRILVAEDYLMTGDRTRAEARLDLLDDPDHLQAIADQIDRNAWTGEVEREALAGLQTALVGLTAPQLPGTNTPTVTIPGTASTLQGLTTLSPILLATSTPEKTLTQVITPNTGSFMVLSRTPICDNTQNPPTLQINVVDADGKPLSGVVLIINSVEGSERVVTGLKTGAGAGGADLTLSVGTDYVITLESGSRSSETITTTQCTSTSGTSFPGGWKLLIQY